MSKINEDTVEQAALRWFQDLGYRYLHGSALAPDGSAPERESFGHVLLLDRLRQALARINPHVPAEALDEVVRRLLRPTSLDIDENNRTFHRWLSRGMQLEVRKDGHTRGELVWLLDFVHPDRNDWLVVNQLKVIEGRHHHRPDVVVYVNGLPLAVIELKNPRDAKATLDTAYRQLQTYKANIPGLLATNEILVIADGMAAQLGSLTAGRDRFAPWRTIDGTGPAPDHLVPLEVLIAGVFEPRRFLDYVRHFILFEIDGGHLIKKIAGYHQLHAVNKAIASTLAAARTGGDGRAGVIWHTQGSGKSISMLFYAAKIALEPAMENPTLVVLTDRNDLDNQLFGQFCRVPDLIPKPEQADDRKHLRELLQVQSGGVVFTTMQKFSLTDEERGSGDARFPLLSGRRNIVVIADEAHRSQYGFDPRVDPETGRLGYGLARNLRDALPGASFLGFTGTPIEGDDRSTPAVFGDYIDVYTISQSVADGTTVPIYYEARLAKLGLREDELPRLDEEFDLVTEDAEAAIKDQLKSRWARLEAIMGARKVLRMLAADIVAHFAHRQQVLRGKAMIVCMSRRICAELYQEIVRLHPDWHASEHERGAIKVVITGNATDPPLLQQHLRSKPEQDAIAARFKSDDDPLSIVIVRDMWLTGFDAPCMHTLYVVKPMQGHGLMQAIARVNRVYRDKPGGLVVDYIGVAEQLRRAVGRYDRPAGQASGDGGDMLDDAPARPAEERLPALREDLETVRALFRGFDHDDFLGQDDAARLRTLRAGANHVLGQPEGKQQFLDVMSRVDKLVTIVAALDAFAPLAGEVAFYQSVAQVLRKHTLTGARQSMDELDAAVRQLVSSAIAPEKVVDIFGAAGAPMPEVSILSEKFLEDASRSQYTYLQAEVLGKVVTLRIEAMKQRNVAQARKFSEMLQRTLIAYQNRTIESAQVVLQLIDMARDIMAEPERSKELGLGHDEMAFYDALVTHGEVRAVMGDAPLAAIARDLVASIRSSLTIDWTQKEAVRARLRQKIRGLLRKHGYPPEERDKALEMIFDQAEQSYRDWPSAA
jgi:type I restriction enzyme R subunit